MAMYFLIDSTKFFLPTRFLAWLDIFSVWFCAQLCGVSCLVYKDSQVLPESAAFLQGSASLRLSTALLLLPSYPEAAPQKVQR